MPSNVIPNGTLASESQASKAITLLLVVTLAISVV
jgi:hypothetical protein